MQTSFQNVLKEENTVIHKSRKDQCERSIQFQLQLRKKKQSLESSVLAKVSASEKKLVVTRILQSALLSPKVLENIIINKNFVIVLLWHSLQIFSNKKMNIENI